MTLDDTLKLRGFTHAELLEPAGIARLDAVFVAELAQSDTALAGRLTDWRAGVALSPVEVSALLLELAPRLEAFIARLFGIETELAAAHAAAQADARVLEFKKQFVQRRARRYRKAVETDFATLDQWLAGQLAAAGRPLDDREQAVAEYGLALLANAEVHAADIDRLTQWCLLCLRDAAGRARVAGWTAFRLPQQIDHTALVPLTRRDADLLGRLEAPAAERRLRDGLDLTDTRMSGRQVMGEAAYCIWCHDHDGDFCAKGFPVKKGEPALGLAPDPLGGVLTGCPVGEKISEMNYFRARGQTVAALAAAMADNPMLPATGHRICNDCQKGCIYQKQTPVDVPQIETGVLTDTLALPWGVEIYELLVRWNPLRQQQWAMQPANGRRVLVVGLGPAGFSMAHHLTMAGCEVVALEAVPVKPPPAAALHEPVRDWQALTEPLSTRVPRGFGGAAEYAIPARWDRNFLTLIHLSLARRRNFRTVGGIRFGDDLTLEDAWALGFEHVVLATGASTRRVLGISGEDGPGICRALDFLEALHRGSAPARLHLPVVVVGGGLTAVDAATEAQAQYIRQVEQALESHEAGEAPADGTGPYPDEFLAHGRAVKAERLAAQAEGRAPDFAPLLQAWGGVTLLYRRRLVESPAYARNAAELANALAEGVLYLEDLQPARIETDAGGAVTALICRPAAGGSERTVPARTVLVAAGVSPDTAYARRHPGALAVDGDHYRPHVLTGATLQPAATLPHCKAEGYGPLTSHTAAGRRVSFIGDTDPAFHGSVVRAIASAARAWPQVMAALESVPSGPSSSAAELSDAIRAVAAGAP